MSGRRPDVNRLFRYFNPGRSEDLNLAEPQRFASALGASVAAVTDPKRPGSRIRDPALRSALLRARLLRGESS